MANRRPVKKILGQAGEKATMHDMNRNKAPFIPGPSIPAGMARNPVQVVFFSFFMCFLQNQGIGFCNLQPDTLQTGLGTGFPALLASCVDGRHKKGKDDKASHIPQIDGF